MGTSSGKASKKSTLQATILKVSSTERMHVVTPRRSESNLHDRCNLGFLHAHIPVCIAKGSGNVRMRS